MLVKAIFQNMFSGKKTNEADSSRPKQDIALISLYDHQRQALTEWIANRMGSKQEIGSPIRNDAAQLSAWAGRMVEWITGNKDVYLEIKNDGIPRSLHREFLQTYEEVKEDLSDYLPSAGRKQVSQRSTADDFVWQAYRDVIFAITEGKILLVRKEELAPYMQGNELCRAVIKERSDIPSAREKAKQCLIDYGTPTGLVTGRLLVISEAITNILKHAEEGNMRVVETSDSLHVIVEDKGPGLSLKLLPNATLMQGYSTKKSLGQGFTLMRQMSDLLLLSTSAEGLTIILQFNGKRGELIGLSS